ncbi:MAG: cupredoxin family protein [Pseudomonadota bacterium]
MMQAQPPRSLALALTLALGLAAGGAAFAHGGDPHARRAGAAVKEQKPWGIAGDAKAVARTVLIRMSDDMRFTPDRIDVREGETLRLKLVNSGRMLHELVIGSQAELDAHAALMLKFPAMEHDEPYMAHVAAGGRGAIVWTFNRAGAFDFACLIPGHYQAGMVGKILVSPRTERQP